MIVNEIPAKLITLGQRVEDKPKKVVLVLPGEKKMLKSWNKIMNFLF